MNPNNIDEQSLAIIQQIMNESHYKLRKFMNKPNTPGTRAQMKGIITEVVMSILESTKTNPVATDDQGNIYDFQGFEVVESSYDPEKVDIKAIWTPRR